MFYLLDQLSNQQGSPRIRRRHGPDRQNYNEVCAMMMLKLNTFKCHQRSQVVEDTVEPSFLCRKLRPNFGLFDPHAPSL